MRPQLLVAVGGLMLLTLPLITELQLDAQSAPTVSFVNGSLNHGATVTITGFGFGSKAQAAPIKYDDFQSVAVGAAISTSSAAGPAWTNNGSGAASQCTNPAASTTRLRPGTPYSRNMRSFWDASACDSNGRDVSNIALVGQQFRKFYFDAWMYNDLSGVTSGAPRNVKHIRLHSASAGAPNLGVTNAGATSGAAYAAARDGTADGGSNPSFQAPITGSTFYGQWIHLQWLVDAGSGGVISNGVVRAYINGTLRYSRNDLSLMNTGLTGWPEVYIGNYIRNDSEYAGTVASYWESMYVDNSWARVEIGNNQTYANCTQREIQIPTTWSDGTISVRLNRGSFPSLNGLYLFVIDAAGNPSQGYALNGGGGSSSGAPSAPTNLRILQ